MDIKFETNTFAKRLKTMLKVDTRRMFSSPLFYIIVGVSLVIPILILVMTGMMEGSVSVDPVTGEETVMQGFKNVWQAIGSLSTDSASAGMDLVSMCNINMMYFFVAVLVCLFVCDDFKSGYAKNLFTVRSKKCDYVISKTIVCFIGGACMIIAFFIGAMIGGMVSSLSFDVGAAGAFGIVMCMISKVLLVAVFVPIFIAVSVGAKQRTWLAVVGSIAVSMLLFTMVPMITPLDSSALNVLLCLAGGAMFSVGLGAVSNLVLNKTNIL